MTQTRVAQVNCRALRATGHRLLDEQPRELPLVGALIDADVLKHLVKAQFLQRGVSFLQLFVVPGTVVRHEHQTQEGPGPLTSNRVRVGSINVFT